MHLQHNTRDTPMSVKESILEAGIALLESKGLRPDPARLADGLLVEALADRGIQSSGSLADTPGPD